MRIFRAPIFLQDALRILANKVWGKPEPPVPDPIIILPDEEGQGLESRISQRIREWRAYNEEPEERLIDEMRRVFTGLGRHYSRELSEAGTGDWLIEPILRALDYYWIPQSHHGQNILDYDLGDKVALEIKKNSRIFDNIGGPNNRARFRTVAEQVVTYLDECNLETILYSNGYFWWRIEREKYTQQLHALRFNMRLAFNEIQTHRTAQHLSRFTPIFHRKAFVPGNNFYIGIHQGLGQRIDPADKVGLVWMKDLNNGYRNVGL